MFIEDGLSILVVVVVAGCFNKDLEVPIDYDDDPLLLVFYKILGVKVLKL